MEYIRAFPAKAGRLVLDSTTAPDLDEYADDLTTAAAIYESELRLFEECAKDEECPGESVSEVQDIILAARDAAEAGQLYGYYGTEYGAGDLEEFTLGSAYLIHHGIFQLTYWPFEEAYPEFKAGIQELESGYMTIFEWYGLSLDGYDLSAGTRDNSYEILSIVNCLDKDLRDTHSEDEYLAQQDKLAAANPFDEMFFDAPNGYEEPFEQNKGCEWTEFAMADPNIPDPPSELAAPVNESGKSFLVVSAKGDTVTPYEYAEKTASQLKSVLLTYSGTGHALGYSGTSSCIDDSITDYLLTGTLPEVGTVCD
jgi:pimeloyl-ACP methyl ester carboxylesterase